MLFLAVALFSLLIFLVCAVIFVVVIVELQERRRAALHAPRPRRALRLHLLQGGRAAASVKPQPAAADTKDTPESRSA